VDMFIASIVFISYIVCLGLCCSVIYHCLLVLYLLFGFFIFFVSINTFLQQSICIVFISHVVGFTLSCYLLLYSCSLLDYFPRCCLGL
jgi:hypothetical protein